MADAMQAVLKLHRIVLSWDYWELSERAAQGLGPMDSLRLVPNTFKDLKVGHAA
jgi:hypothetical protein